MRFRIALVVLCSLIAPVRAADSGGVVEGHIKYAGKKQPSEPKVVPKPFSSFCGASKVMPDLVLSRDRGLVNVVVSVAGVPAKAQAKDITINQKSCEYLPHVQATTLGSKLTVINSDPVLHNVHASNGSQTVCNMAMPIEGQKVVAPPQVLGKTGRIGLKCDAGHSWMSAYVFVFDHPFFDVSDASGNYRISGLPAGTYEVKFEHELFGTQTRKVTVPASGAAKLDLTFE